MNLKKNVLLKISKIVAFFIVFCFVVAIAYNVLSWKDTTGDYYSTMKQLEATDSGLIDVVFVGSSQVYCDIYPCFIWENTGISSFDMTVSSMDKDSSCHYLKELLKSQSPKVVFVDLYALTFDEHEVDGNIYRNMLSLKPSYNSISLVNDYFEDKDVDKLDYYFRFPIVHTRYKELKRFDYTEFKPNNFLRGESVSFVTKKADKSPSADTEYESDELTPKNKKWLDALYELSVKNNFELVLIKTPFYAYKPHQTQIEAARVFADSNNIKFLDMNKHLDEIGFDFETDFMDNNHTNAYGAKKIADYLSDYMVNNFDLPNHQGDSKYWQWDKDLEFYNRESLKKELSECTNIYQVSNLLLDDRFTDFYAIISAENSGASQGEKDYYFDALKYCGINADDFGRGGKWLFYNKNIEFLMPNELSSAVRMVDLNKYDSLSVKYNGDSHPENVMIGANDYSNGDSYISVTIYDNLLEEVLIQYKY